MPALHRRMPDRRARRSGHARLEPLPLLLDAGTGVRSGAVPGAARLAGLRLRHLPGGLSVEPRDREAQRRASRSPAGAEPVVSLVEWLEADGVELVERYDRLYVPRNDPALAAPERAHRRRERRRPSRARRSRAIRRRRGRRSCASTPSGRSRASTGGASHEADPDPRLHPARARPACACEGGARPGRSSPPRATRPLPGWWSRRRRSSRSCCSCSPTAGAAGTGTSPR